MSGVVHVEQVMGTAVTIDVRGVDLDDRPDRQVAMAVAIEGAVAVLHEADRVFSTWRTDSDVSRLRRGEIVVADCDPSMPEVIEVCVRSVRISDGWFDPWRMPGGFDPTGLVKGWAAQRASDFLVEAGFGDHMVNAGGDVVVRGRASVVASGTLSAGWRVGVTNPEHRDRVVQTILVQDGAVATSARYERGSLAIDPRRGATVTQLASATVTGPDLAIADALATAASAAGPTFIAWVDGLAAYEAMLTDLDQHVMTTRGWTGRPLAA